MLHHVSFGVADLQRAAAFYDAALSALGYRRVYVAADAVGYGIEDGKDKLLLKARAETHAPGPGFHMAFTAGSRKAVDDFHYAGMRAGGVDNGAPGPRPHYGPHYYAAFLIDPDGHRIEAVINEAEP